MGKFGGSRKKFRGGERRAEGRVRLLRTLGSAELRKIASGSATQDLSLTEKRKSEISVRRHRPKPIPWEKSSWGNYEEGDPAIERRREYTDLGFDLGEREEQDVCHASALAMTDEAR